MKLITAALFSLVATGAFAAPVVTGSSSLGDVLTDEAGMTLYVFKKDTAGVSNCYDGCAANWPPMFASEMKPAEGDYTVIERTDGTYQWAYKGEPLYYWVNDHKAGDTTGEGVGGNWFAGRP